MTRQWKWKGVGSVLVWGTWIKVIAVSTNPGVSSNWARMFFAAQGNGPNGGFGAY